MNEKSARVESHQGVSATKKRKASAKNDKQKLTTPLGPISPSLSTHGAALLQRRLSYILDDESKSQTHNNKHIHATNKNKDKGGDERKETGKNKKDVQYCRRCEARVFCRKAVRECLATPCEKKE
jgi:hypothetical protein